MEKIRYNQALAQAIVDTIREPLLVLDDEMRVVAASRSFYQIFKSTREETEGRLLDTLGDGQWLGEHFDGDRRLAIILRSNREDDFARLGAAPLATPLGGVMSIPRNGQEKFSGPIRHLLAVKHQGVNAAAADADN